MDSAPTATFTPSPESWVDMALGRFIRTLPALESLLFLTASAATGRSIADQEVLTVSEAITDVEKNLVRFPQRDRVSLARAMVDAREVFDIRHNLVHGRWSEVEGEPMTFVSVLPMRSRKATRRHVERNGATFASGVTADGPSSARLTFNYDLIRSVRATALVVGRWLDEHLDAWEEHFGVTYDDE